MTRMEKAKQLIDEYCIQNHFFDPSLSGVRVTLEFRNCIKAMTEREGLILMNYYINKRQLLFPHSDLFNSLLSEFKFYPLFKKVAYYHGWTDMALGISLRPQDLPGYV